ncbi:MAG TPA: ATP-binding protein [Flavobacteriaceae bacterium]|nr:ATP-binding protein [Flavobacteriaceae bacterium]
MLTTEFKQRIINAINERNNDFSSDAKMAVYLNINTAQLSRVKKGDTDKVLSEANWLRIARLLNIRPNKQLVWHTAKTPAYQFIYQQLKECQALSISGVLCDLTDIGKTHTAKAYARENKHVAYIDCSQVKTKQLLVRKIAQEFGVVNTGRYVDVYNDLIYYLQFIEKPLVILDEAGDLKPDAFLELKALWNATERACGWYMLGADGLKHKIEKGRDLFKVGFAEIFRRYGKRYQRVSPQGKDLSEEFMRKQFALVSHANGVKDIKEMYAKSGGSLERIRIEVEKRQVNARN